MEKFKIKIIETLSRVIEVEADSMDEALELAEQRWDKQEEILSGDDFEEVNFYPALDEEDN